MRIPLYVLAIKTLHMTPRKAVLIAKSYSKLHYNKFKINSGCLIQIEENAELFLDIGFINSDSKIQCYSKIEIGDRCFNAQNVFIRDNDGHELRYEGKRKKRNEIIIGNNVWLGTGCIILNGTIIGDNTIIDAGSVVNKEFPPNVLTDGNPTRVIKTDITWE